jgi:hypothetical protein
MKTITLALSLAVFACGTAPATETQHAAIVDMPKVANLSQHSEEHTRNYIGYGECACSKVLSKLMVHSFAVLTIDAFRDSV